MTQWVLVLWLHLGYKGSVTHIPMHNAQACINSMEGFTEKGVGVPYNITYCLNTETGEVVNQETKK